MSHTEHLSQAGKTANKRDHSIAHSDEIRQTTSAIRISEWAVGVAALIVLAAIVMVKILTGAA